MFRFYVLLRGELFSPSDHNPSAPVPLQLDCAKVRTKQGFQFSECSGEARCCGSLCNFQGARPCVKWSCLTLACVWELICTVPLALGSFNAWFYANRHWIGP
jgi:hypothetical protein